jgi:hypothetical protein
MFSIEMKQDFAPQTRNEKHEQKNEKRQLLGLLERDFLSMRFHVFQVNEY